LIFEARLIIFDAFSYDALRRRKTDYFIFLRRVAAAQPLMISARVRCFFAEDADDYFVFRH